ncbi:MAG: helix-turn-helix domain-containing protein [Proteobacteria bacterium]|nr:helix-turn-helix domain-containing protein [Pseudomonadota bacterium]
MIEIARGLNPRPARARGELGIRAALLRACERQRAWPLLRSADELNENKKAILDAAWGFYVAGDVSFPVSASVTRFHPKKLGTLRVLAKSSGHDSIYQIAKMTGRDYRRVYDDIMDFVADGIAIVATEIRNGRKSKVARLHGLHIA